MKPESNAKRKKLEKEARERILARGKLEFRVEPELMSAVLDLAKKQTVPVGRMLRQWVRERVDEENNIQTESQSQLDVIERKIDLLLSRQQYKNRGVSEGDAYQ